MKVFIKCALFLVSILFCFTISTSRVEAYSACAANASWISYLPSCNKACGTNEADCIDPICGGVWSCSNKVSGNLGCADNGVQCSAPTSGLYGCPVYMDYCSTVVATPTPTPGFPTPTPGDGGGGTCNGSCQTLDATHANCGAWGLLGGSGSCGGGQVCCVSQGTQTCKFQIPPGPIVLAVGETYKLTPTGNDAQPPNSKTITDRFDYSTSTAANGKITFNPTVKNKTCKMEPYHGNPNDMRLICRTPASGWGTIITAKSPTSGVVNNGIRVTCHIIDSSVNTVKSIGVEVLPPPPPPGWWQAVDGDVLSQGDLRSDIPTGAQRFILPGIGGYPGIALYGDGGSFDFTNDAASTGTPSTKGWLVSSDLSLKKYDYAFFEGLIPTNTVFYQIAGDVNANVFTEANPAAKVSPDGYFWYKATGNTTINGALAISATRKVILFVDGGKLTIGGNVTITDPGQGFFMAIVGGPIDIAPTVTTLHGMYISDDTFSTGVSAVQLNVKGSVVSYSGVSLQRDLAALNATTPAEVFQFDPALLFTYPKSLTPRKVVWREVAP